MCCRYSGIVGRRTPWPRLNRKAPARTATGDPSRRGRAAFSALLTPSAGNQEPVERLGIGKAVGLAERRAALAHVRRHRCEVGELAPVARERLELEVHRLRDVDRDVMGLRLPLHDENLTHSV